MGLIYGSLDDYTWGFLLLAITAALSGLFTATAVRRRATR
jgi:NNP family nitrate/nitrite transporter-like MFS transporter